MLAGDEQPQRVAQASQSHTKRKTVRRQGAQPPKLPSGLLGAGVEFKGLLPIGGVCRDRFFVLPALKVALRLL